MSKYRKWLEIDKESLRNNINYVKSKLNENTKIMAIVKADGYGHGSVECSKLFLDQGASYLAVSSLGEALVLRKFNIIAPILVLGYIDKDNLIEAIGKDIIFTIYNIELAKELNEIANSLDKKVKIHIKINTGMNRVGFYSGVNESKFDISIKNIIEISKLNNIVIDGIFSHFSNDTVEECGKQFNNFTKLLTELEKKNIKLGLRHICNSWGTLNCPEFQLDMVRPGIALYGYGNDNLKPAASLKAIVINILEIEKEEGVSYNKAYIAGDDCTLAVIPVGYADGLSRVLSNKINININRNEYEQVGNICMDSCMVKVDKSVKIGDEAYIIGGKSENDAESIAKVTGTIVYEIICKTGKRVPKVYIN